MNQLPRTSLFNQRRIGGNIYSDVDHDTQPLVTFSYDSIYQGWVEVSLSKTSTKTKSSWLKKATVKQWKWRYAVLVRQLEATDKVSLELYEKEDNWGNQAPKKSLEMYPRYKVTKRGEFKGKLHVFEVNNDEDTYSFAVDSQKAMDLWVIQIQMQTKLSRSISGRIFSVVPCKSKPLQRIGARDQRCLLHFTQWGLTLALQDSRSILAMWPLSTIRNYECTGSGNFSFESGRRAPMGTGVYSFGTYKGDDEAMFSVIDAFVNARLNARAEVGGHRREEDTTDEEVLATYDKLHSCALGFLPHDLTPGIDGYAVIGPSLPSDPDFMMSCPPPSYDHLASSGLIQTVSQNNSSTTEDDHQSCPPHSRNESISSTGQSYDQLDRTQSWGTKSETGNFSYDRLNVSVAALKTQDSYDHIGWAGTSGPTKFQASYGTLGQQLTHEPSVPSILDGFSEENNFGERSRLFQQQTSSDDPFVYTNQIYQAKSDFKIKPKEAAGNSVGSGIKQHRSSVSGPKGDPIDSQPTSQQKPETNDTRSPCPTPPIQGNYENEGSASTVLHNERKSLLSQEIEGDEPISYQNLGLATSVTNEATIPLEDSGLPAKTEETIRFVPKQ